MPGEGDGHFLLVYGSETGQAKAIAEKIFVDASQHGLNADLCCFSETDKKFDISKEKCVVIILSTTGDGDPPQTVHKFWRKIRKRTLPSDYLSEVNYALLALGDSNYNNFCNCGKTIDKRFEALSAKRFYPTGYGDDAVGLEECVEPWIDGLWTALKAQLSISSKQKNIMAKETNSIDTSEVERISNLKINDNESIEHNNVVSTETSPTNHEWKNNISDNNASIETTKLNDPINQCEATATAKDQRQSLCTPSLVNIPLKLPSVPPCNLEVTFISEISPEIKINSNNEYCPSSASHITDATITSAKWLTSSPDVKKFLQLTIHIKDRSIGYEPGDSFGFKCCNDSVEVEEILYRLNMTNQADAMCHLKFKDIGKGRKKSIPHLPEYSTLRHLFTCCCEIRAIPKKVFLRLLSEYTSDEKERRRLSELSSREGSTEYMSRIFEPQLSLLDILTAFPSCKPSVEAILENLPSLRPRFYSVASCPLSSPDSFNILFNIVEIERNNTKGVCTGWLSKLVDHKDNSADTHTLSPDTTLLAQKSLSKEIKIYKRNNMNFYLPNDPSTPIIMVGPGTGVAPFIGFLQHRLHQSINKALHFGQSWLFYGCRYEEKDYLYKEELQKFHSNGILTRLLVAFSRQNPKNYVQDIIVSYSKDIVELIKDGAIIYVCGDAKNMSQDVFKAFASVWSTTEGCTMEAATNQIKKLQEEKRYLQDIWA